MHLARSRRIQLPTPVIKPESHIRRLLNLCDEESSVSSMNRSRSDIYHITLLRLDHIQKLLSSTILALFIKLLCSHFTLEAAIHLRTRLCIHHIPDFSLSEGIISFYSHIIVRMHLYRKFVIYIKKLYQKRELTSIPFIHILSHYSFKISLHKVAHRITGKPTVCNYRVLGTHICKFPTLTEKDIRTEYGLISFLITLHKFLSKNSHKSITAPRSP